MYRLLVAVLRFSSGLGNGEQNLNLIAISKLEELWDVVDQNKSIRCVFCREMVANEGTPDSFYSTVQNRPKVGGILDNPVVKKNDVLFLLTGNLLCLTVLSVVHMEKVLGAFLGNPDGYT